MSENGVSDNRKAIDYCDSENQKAGRILIGWINTDPHEESDSYIGFNPETRAITGPGVCVGSCYKIIYQIPVILPFIDPKKGPVAYHVAEIIGRLISIHRLADVSCVICSPDDYAVRSTLKSNKSIFRLFVGDKLEKRDSD